MNMTISGNAKEIATLVVAIQERQTEIKNADAESIPNAIRSILNDQIASSDHTLAW